jgi:hypothetical protein
MSDIEEALKRITAHQGVMGVAVFDDTGKLARYSLPQVRREIILNMSVLYHGPNIVLI